VINSDGSDAHEINGGFDPAWGPPEQLARRLPAWP
jgi:hypothetical protein